MRVKEVACATMTAVGLSAAMAAICAIPHRENGTGSRKNSGATIPRAPEAKVPDVPYSRGDSHAHFMSGTCSGSRAHPAAFCHAGRRLACRSTAICRFPAQMTASVAVVAAGAHERRRARPAAQASSTAPLPSTQGRGAPSCRGINGSNTPGETRCTMPLAVKAPITTRVPSGNTMQRPYRDRPPRAPGLPPHPPNRRSLAQWGQSREHPAAEGGLP